MATESAVGSRSIWATTVSLTPGAAPDPPVVGAWGSVGVPGPVGVVGVVGVVGGVGSGQPGDSRLRTCVAFPSSLISAGWRTMGQRPASANATVRSSVVAYTSGNLMVW